jgi:hypothetical protein
VGKTRWRDATDRLREPWKLPRAQEGKSCLVMYKCYQYSSRVLIHRQSPHQCTKPNMQPKSAPNDPTPPLCLQGKKTVPPHMCRRPHIPCLAVRARTSSNGRLHQNGAVPFFWSDSPTFWLRRTAVRAIPPFANDANKIMSLRPKTLDSSLHA